MDDIYNIAEGDHSVKPTYRFQVDLDLTEFSKKGSSLCEVFTEMWLLCNCKSAWTIEKVPKLPKLVVSFADPQEAIYFKLSHV